MFKNNYHREILGELKAHSGKPHPKFGAKYSGHNDPSLPMSTPTMRKIAKKFKRDNRDLEIDEFIKLLNSLYKGVYNEEKSFAGKLLEYFPKLRKQVDPKRLNSWLNNLKGWAQVDSLCQSVFTSDDLLSKWRHWKSLLIALSKNKNVNKRRASLVLLTAPVRQSDDERFVKLAFKLIDKLKGEKDILITKAISWLLRDMIKHHRQKVEGYINKNSKDLPRLAIRETRRKLLTGKK